jgi:hypothetical protein
MLIIREPKMAEGSVNAKRVNVCEGIIRIFIKGNGIVG